MSRNNLFYYFVFFGSYSARTCNCCYHIDKGTRFRPINSINFVHFYNLQARFNFYEECKMMSHVMWLELACCLKASFRRGKNILLVVRHLSFLVAGENDTNIELFKSLSIRKKYLKFKSSSIRKKYLKLVLRWYESRDKI